MHFPLTMAFPLFAAIAVALCLVICVAAVARRIAFPPTASVLAILGLLCLALAAGGPLWRHRSRERVAVMVDLSPSTRTASFRDRAWLDRRLRDLLGATPYKVYGFADRVAPLPGGPTLADIAADRTVFDPPPADDVLLFSDGRFGLPGSAPPTYAVIDPALSEPIDGAARQLEIRGGEAIAAVSSQGRPGVATFTGTRGPAAAPVWGGALTIARPLAEGASSVSVALAPPDAWPEDDALTAPVVPPAASERWWVGGRGGPGPPWRAIAPDALPSEPAAYLAPAVIVLDDVPAAALSPAASDRLTQYVRDLGGALVILGGDGAFAAGGYVGTPLGALSPLASSPPRPAMRWTILADASGSMAQDAGGGRTRWDLAAGAAADALRALPPDDPVRIGQFSDVVRWWSDGGPAREVAKRPLPPADASPHGPTNLAAAIDAVGADATGDLPGQLLVVSDADAEIPDAAGLADRLKAKKVHLSLLALADGSGLGAMTHIAAATGGAVLRQLDPVRWAAAARDLARAAMPGRVNRTSAAVRFVGDASRWGTATARVWNRTWQKESATRLAETVEGGETIPMAASWQAGAGQVVAVAFRPSDATAAGLAGGVATPPRDPRISVTFDAAERLRVGVDAVDGRTSLNGLDLLLTLGDDPAHPIPLAQTAPGRYELDAPAPRRPQIATLRLASRIVDRFAVPGRYAPEFDAIGNDLPALRRLATQTGGAVIPPEQTRPIDFRQPLTETPLTPHLAIAGSALIATALIRWHRA